MFELGLLVVRVSWAHVEVRGVLSGGVLSSRLAVMDCVVRIVRMA